MSGKLNKRQLLKKIISFPRGASKDFFSKEMKLLNRLLEKYSEDFLSKLTFDKKFDSLAILFSEYFSNQLDIKFKNFNYKVDESRYLKINLSEDKSGDAPETTKKTKTIKQFLNG